MYENLLDSIGFVSSVDAEVGEAMAKEHLRQQNNIELIASENIVSKAVLLAAGTWFTYWFGKKTEGME